VGARNESGNRPAAEDVLRLRSYLFQAEPVMERMEIRQPGFQKVGVKAEVKRFPNQKMRRERCAIYQHPQHREKIRSPLNFIDHHQSSQVRKAVTGWSSRARLMGFQVKVLTELGETNSRARVVLPHCLGPTRATTRCASIFFEGFA